MRFKTVLVSLALMVFVSNQVFAESSWVEEFLKRYQPPMSSTGAGAAALNSPTPAAKPADDTDPSQVFQTGEVPISMNDLVILMLQKNLNVQADRFTPRSTYLSALAFWQALMPSFTASFNEGRNTAANTNQINGANVTSLSTLTHTFTAGYSELFSPGTVVGVNFSMIRTSSNNQLATFNPSFSGRVNYTVTQPLLNGRGKIVNERLLLEGLNTEKSTEAAFELQLTTLIAQSEKAYWNLVFTIQNADVNRRAVDESQVELEQDKTKLEIGTLAQSDVLQTQQSLASRQVGLVSSVYAETQAEDQLKRMISDQTDPSMFMVKLKALDVPALTTPVPSLEEAVKIALENRPEIREAQFDLQNKDIDISYYHNLHEPILSVTGSYTQNGTGGNQIIRNTLGGASNTIIPGGLSDALSQLYGFGYNGYSAGVSLIVPLNTKAVDANYGWALNQKKLSQSNMNAVRQQVALDVRNALSEVAQYKATIDVAQLTLDLAKQQGQNEKVKLDLGTSQIRFVLEDEISVIQDETALLQAKISLANAFVDLDQAMGLTLKKYNVDLTHAIEQTGETNPTAPVHGGLLNLFKK